MDLTKYVLITAARNEQDYIEKTILSVIAQTKKPEKWVIVSDGSLDNTEEIVRKYEKDYSFIKLVVKISSEGRDFASKVYAIQLGLELLDNIDYDFIGILDADVSFENNYYSSLIDEFRKNPILGIAGGKYFDIVEGKLIPIYSSPYSVRGATQFFRKECFNSIGGIKPMKYGGEDGLACVSARMHGWELENFGYLTVLHHRPTGTSGRNLLKTRVHDGFVEYHLGFHPLFQFVKSIRRIKQKPFLLGSLLRIYGFWLANFKKERRFVSDEFIKFIRTEQLKRITKLNY